MFPYSVTSNYDAANLYKLKDGRFQIIKKGDLSLCLQGYDYVLVKSELGDFLNSLNIPQVEFKDAIIWDRGLNIENKNFKELIVKNPIYYLEDFEGVKLEGLQMYIYDRQYLFVSPKLKEILETSEFNQLSFGEGWSNFVH